MTRQKLLNDQILQLQMQTNNIWKNTDGGKFNCSTPSIFGKQNQKTKFVFGFFNQRLTVFWFGWPKIVKRMITTYKLWNGFLKKYRMT